MKTTSIFLAVGLLASIINLGCEQKASTDDVVTVKTIETSVAKIGGQATVEKYLFDTSEVHQPALAQIETGNKEWVDMGVKMLQYSDAGSTEGLLSALAGGMQQKPENVLPYVNKPGAKSTTDEAGGAAQPMLTPEKVCLPFISSEIPAAEQLAIVQRTKKALLTVNDPSLKSQCDACLREVAEMERTIQTSTAGEKK